MSTFFGVVRFIGTVPAGVTSEFAQVVKRKARPGSMVCRRGVELGAMTLWIRDKQVLDGPIPLEFFSPVAFAVRLQLPDVDPGDVVKVALQNPTEQAVTFDLEIGERK